jgi:hypothetical protein
MADNNVVEIRFGASTDDALDGIAQVRDALIALTAQVNGLGSNLDRLGDTFGKVLAADKLQQLTKGFGEAGAAAQGVTAQVQSMGGQMKLAQEQYGVTVKLADEAFSQTREHLAAEVRLHEISYSEETAALLAALEQKRAAEEAALATELKQQKDAVEARKAALTDEMAQQKRAAEDNTAQYNKEAAALQKLTEQEIELTQKSTDKRKEIDARYFAERQKMVDQAAEQEAKEWKSVADQVSGAFNSQLAKMLQGKESWAQASRKIEQDLALKFIEDQVKMTAEFLAGKARELAATIMTETGKTSATTAGAALRAAADTASGQTSILETIANALKAIFAGAGQTAAGVSGNLAPAIGPAAVPAGAAAGAAVVALSTALAGGGGGSFDVGTNYVVRGGIAHVHSGETIVPAGMPVAQGSGPYRPGANASGANVSVNISALDSRSVARFFNDNAGHMIRAINKGIKSGAHLGLRTARA